jgi:hypothetical protein
MAWSPYMILEHRHRTLLREDNIRNRQSVPENRCRNPPA